MALAATGAEARTIDHKLSVTLDPASGSIAVRDTVTLEEPAGGDVVFSLHSGLMPRLAGMGEALAPLGPDPEGPPWAERYRVRVGGNSFTLEYGGAIRHEIAPVGKEYARGFSSSPGIISPEGAVLSAESRWFPSFGDEATTFSMEISLPEGWDAVSQGSPVPVEVPPGRSGAGFVSGEPGDDVYLIAAKFTKYERRVGKVTAQAFLRTPDAPLAAKFLDATGQYVAMYEKLIGPYPFGKFALVENFWETGFGMPSFTLLGPKVIRFPFILRSSYPHEILHNWWGNSVYVDYSTGNWAEGLTAYLADHLMREQQGASHEYREATLQKYADYVADKADAPLSSFVSRHSSSTEALGYGKSLMVFHMLRREVGESKFREGLALFYSDNLWKRASWADLRKSFEAVSGRDLGRFFAQWVGRTGAPALALEEVRVEGGGPWEVSGTIRQTQAGEAYRLKAPVAVTVEGRRETFLRWVECEGESTDFAFAVEGRPLRVDLDPFFDLFRLVGKEETPPALSGAFGASPQYIVVPSGASPELAKAYGEVAEFWKGSSEGKAEIITDADRLPETGALWILGWENAKIGLAREALAGYPAKLGEREVELGAAGAPRAGHSFVATGEAGGRQVTFVAADSPAPLPGLARKLPHYGKYSYLAFEGEEPVNVAKGRWDAAGSRLAAVFSPGASRGAPPSSQPIAELPPVFSRERMSETVTLLASPEFEGRGAGSTGLEKAASFIEAKFREAGLRPAYGQSYFAGFAGKAGGGKEAALKNVVGFVQGTNPAFEGQTVVVGAHYDHLGFGWPDARKGSEGKLHPGADDNASGVAVLLELARRFAVSPPERTVVFAAFSGEEQGRAGSRAFLSSGLPWPKEKTIGMVNLDTVGRLGDGKILFLGASSAREWIHIANGAGFVTGAKVEAAMKDVGSSDQTSFLEAGIPAVQIFTGAHPGYHSPEDAPDRIDYAGLSAVAQVAFEAVDYLARREGGLTSTLAGGGQVQPLPTKEGGRKVSLGTVPDFAYPGEGVRLSGVTPGSPAEKAGLREGDVIVGLNGAKVSDLKVFSAEMKRLSVGQTAKVEYLRDGKAAVVEMAAAER